MDEARPIPADWLSLRESADAEARQITRADVCDLVRTYRPGVIIDVGSGTGAGARWMASCLDGDERWVLIDHDQALLGTAAAGLRRAGVEAEITEVLDDLSCLGDVLDEVRAEGGSALVITSALLDLLTEPQLADLLDVVAVRRVPLIAALTVTGGLVAEPSDPVDELIREAFDAHQRHGDRLGPDAVERTQQLALARGIPVRAVPTPWRLSASASVQQTELMARLLRDRAEAAGEELRHRGDRRGLTTVQDWLRRRLHQLDLGALHLQIDHTDLFLPAVTHVYPKSVQNPSSIGTGFPTDSG